MNTGGGDVANGSAPTTMAVEGHWWLSEGGRPGGVALAVSSSAECSGKEAWEAGSAGGTRTCRRRPQVTCPPPSWVLPQEFEMIEARRLPQRSGFPISSWGSGPSGTPAPSARDGVGDTAQAIFLSLFHVVFFHTHARAHISVQTHAHSHLTVPGLVCMSSSESPSL